MAAIEGFNPIRIILDTCVGGRRKSHCAKFQPNRLGTAPSRGSRSIIGRLVYKGAILDFKSNRIILDTHDSGHRKRCGAKFEPNQIRFAPSRGSKSIIGRLVYMGAISGFKPVRIILYTRVSSHRKSHCAKCQPNRIRITPSRGLRSKIGRSVYMEAISGFKSIRITLDTRITSYWKSHCAKFQPNRLGIAPSRGSRSKIGN